MSMGLRPGGPRSEAEALLGASGLATACPMHPSLRVWQLGRRRAYCHDWHARSTSAISV